MAIEKNAAGKIIGKKFSIKKLESCAKLYIGLCRACGAEKEGVEGDAEKYVCEGCGLAHVYGAEQLAIMGCVK